MKAAIITSSDSGYAGEREDKSGSVIQEILEANDYEVVHTILLPDDRKMLADEMARIADEGIAELIVTTGGTGFSPRDCMPEATKDIIEREVPGIPEAMRAYSMTITPRAMLKCSSRYSKRNTDRESAGKPESSQRKSGIYYSSAGTWITDPDRGGNELCQKIIGKCRLIYLN